MSRVRIMTMVIIAIVLMFAQSSTARAQWGTSGTNIYNTNSGNVGIGTTTPAANLEISGDNPLPRVTNTNASSFGGLRLFEGGTLKFGLQTMGSASGSTYVGGANAVQLWNYANGPMVFGTNANERMRIDANGNVGIGTTAPGYSLDVQANAQWAARFKKTDATNGGIIVDAAAGYNPNVAMSVNGAIKWYMNSNTSNGDTLQFWESTGTTPRFTLTQAGTVGIGTATPSTTYKLDVNGGINASGNINSTGNITAAGSINAKYQDVAEWVESSQSLPAGTVVVLDQTKSNQVIASSQAYDTRVAGVVSAQPGITLGEKGESKVLVATTGRVKVRVDATNGPIQVGDLLVTSDMAGVAKKSEPLMLGGVPIHRPGTLIGKALEPLAQGQQCEILVLLSLQ
jgi:hypothetical protein